MATGQSLLNLMEMVFPELQNQSGEADVVKSLLALNAAQDLFETMLAAEPNVSGSVIGTVTTTLDTEATTFPTRVLRLDRLQYIDTAASPNMPAWDLIREKRVGGHATDRYWPMSLISNTTTGKPRAYWTNGINIYWNPVPNGAYTIRWYGFQGLADITAAGTYGYLDASLLPVATVAAGIVRTGLDDSAGDVDKLSNSLLRPLLNMMSRFDRDTPSGYEYRYTHST